MLYREIIAVCSEIHTKHINTLCGQNVELLNVKHGGTYSNHWALEVLSASPLGYAVTDDLPVPSHPKRKSEVCCSTEICCKSWRTFARPSCSHSSWRHRLLGTRTAS